MARLAAFIVMLIPGLMAAGGIKFMRDTLFGKLIAPFPFLWLQFVVGVILFVIGFGFFAGFLLHRDRKMEKLLRAFKKIKIAIHLSHLTYWIAIFIDGAASQLLYQDNQ